ncbi:MAG: hypothetical protein AAB225_31385 [Acidobacteriota bacterium]
MDLLAFQYDRGFLLDALRHGELDYLEHVSAAAEADFFRHLIRRDVLNRLAERYPTVCLPSPVSAAPHSCGTGPACLFTYFDRPSSDPSGPFLRPAIRTRPHAKPLQPLLPNSGSAAFNRTRAPPEPFPSV